MATYIIGDVQGCFKELTKLCELFNFNPSRDTLWFCGDIINRGPDSLKTIRFIKNLGDKAITVLGNHDLHFLAVAFGVRRAKKSDTLDAILQAEDKDEIIEWLRFRPVLHVDHKGKAIMVHAGIPPWWDLNQCETAARELESALQGENYINVLQDMFTNEPSLWNDSLSQQERLIYITNAYTRMRFIGPNNKLNFTHKGPPENVQKSDKLTPWFLNPNLCINRDYSIFFGHWASLQGKCTVKNIYSLDTGCVWGESLTAYCLETKKYFSVKAIQSQLGQ